MTLISRLLGLLGRTQTTYLRGLDVSHHNTVTDWDAALVGLDFAVVKATEGTTYRDPKFDQYWAALKSRAIVRGAYHYYRPIFSLTEQADNFYQAAQDTQLPPILDVEVWAQGNPQDLAYYRNTPKPIIQDQLHTMLNLIEARFGMRPIIYTARWFWDQYVGIAGWEEQYPLWVASYTSGGNPLMPSAWSAWCMWQYTASGSLPGVSGNVDLNYFSGDRAALLELCAGYEPPEPIGYARVLTDGLRVRSKPWGATLRYLNAGDIVPIYTYEQLDTWAQIGGGYACVQNKGTQHMEWVEDPITFEIDAPVGTPEERTSGKIWPGEWFSAQGYLAGGSHTGDDLNLNVPTWDSDAHAPVYSIADNGVVVYAATVPAPSTWGGVVVIRYTVGDLVFWARYAHVENILVSVGDEVYRGQHIANVGEYQGNPKNFHLHFDIADDILQSDPLNWPGNNPDFIRANYHSPAAFIVAHRDAPSVDGGITP